MNLQRRKDLELRDSIQIIVDADCNDGDYVRETTTMPFENFTDPAFPDGWTVEEYIDILRRSIVADRDWVKFCQDATKDVGIGDYLHGLVPCNIHDGMEVSIASITVLFYDPEGKVYEVLA